MPDKQPEEPERLPDSEAEEGLNVPPPFFPYEESLLPVDEPFEPGEPVEVRVEAVFAAQAGTETRQFVLLSDGERKLPIVIGRFEAMAITYSLEGQQPDRPMTHDLMKAIIDKMDAIVDRIVIDDLWGSTYYAKIYLKRRGTEIMVDARPSDAIALAVRFDCPIFVAEGILAQNAH
jgi:bifunctional DNase/RNase